MVATSDHFVQREGTLCAGRRYPQAQDRKELRVCYLRHDAGIETSVGRVTVLRFSDVSQQSVAGKKPLKVISYPRTVILLQLSAALTEAHMNICIGAKKSCSSALRLQ